MVGLYAINLQEPQSSENAAINIPSLSALENTVRNGTLLCSVAGGVFKVPIKAWSKQPKSYNQCLCNVEKAVEAFRRIKELPPGMFYAGMEDDIVRGEWSIIVELLFELSNAPNSNITLSRIVDSSRKESRINWRGESTAEIIPIQNKRSSSKNPTESQTTNILASDLLGLDCNTNHLPAGSVDIYPKKSGNCESAVRNNADNGALNQSKKTVDSFGDKEPSDDDLDVLLGIGSMGITKPAPTDSEVAAIMGESISSKLIRELEEAARYEAQTTKPQGNVTNVNLPTSNSTGQTSKSSADIFPG